MAQRVIVDLHDFADALPPLGRLGLGVGTQAAGGTAGLAAALAGFISKAMQAAVPLLAAAAWRWRRETGVAA